LDNQALIVLAAVVLFLVLFVIAIIVMFRQKRPAPEEMEEGDKHAK
jgi:flagellar biosynthesis/type III secretory pathway M-ring protein FliF/YscJ